MSRSETDFDVVVIGGGINGTGVAQAVAAAGYSVALLEKSAVAAETDAFTRSRESCLVADDTQQPHALSVFGGKITSYRATARKVLQMCEKTLERRASIADTSKLFLKA